MYELIIALSAILFAGIKAYSQQGYPDANKESSGVWVATVSNVDWPSRPGLSIDLQREELVKILDKHKSERLNVNRFRSAQK
jgi:hypothetical protein